MEIKVEINTAGIEERVRQIFRDEFDRAIDVLNAMNVASKTQAHDYLTVSELCKELRISRATANKLIRDRKIESRKIGGKRQIERRAVDKYRSI